jgi:hypothetical protein
MLYRERVRDGDAGREQSKRVYASRIELIGRVTPGGRRGNSHYQQAFGPAIDEFQIDIGQAGVFKGLAEEAKLIPAQPKKYAP